MYELALLVIVYSDPDDHAGAGRHANVAGVGRPGPTPELVSAGA
jgi:hypothetical protein